MKLNNLIHIIKNFFISAKIISKIKKNFILKKTISVIIKSMIIFAYPYILKILLDCIENNFPIKIVIIHTTSIIILCFLLNIIDSILTNSLSCDVNKINAIMTKKFNENTLNANYEFLERPEIQDLYELANNSLRTDEGIIGITTKMLESMGYIITFFVSGFIIININPFLILIIISISIIKIVLEKYKQKKNKKEMREKAPPLLRKINYCNSSAQNLQLAKDIRVYKIDKMISRHRNDSVQKYLKLVKQNNKRNLIISILIYALNLISEISLYLFMINEVFNGMAISIFTFSISSVKILMSAINSLIGRYGLIYKCSLSVDDYLSFLDSEVFDEENTAHCSFNEIEIEFKNVYYSYYLQDGYTLKNLSFKINRGEIISLVGVNGAGKTTLIKLICGLYKPTKGEIYINGRNINNIAKHELYKMISPVFQDNFIFATSIAENIASDVYDAADIEKVNEIIEIIGLVNKINSLPNKIKSILNRELYEDGIELSGGENQKLSIAKVIYKESPLVILDEPTSALDPLAESRFYANISKIIRNRTCIFISHRLSSTKFCDKIFLIDNGEILENGTHNELMSYESYYKKLFNKQSQYYNGEYTNEEN